MPALQCQSGGLTGMHVMGHLCTCTQRQKRSSVTKTRRLCWFAILEALSIVMTPRSFQEHPNRRQGTLPPTCLHAIETSLNFNLKALRLNLWFAVDLSWQRMSLQMRATPSFRRFAEDFQDGSRPNEKCALTYMISRDLPYMAAILTWF